MPSARLHPIAPPLRITGAPILGPEGWRDGPLLLAEGRIAEDAAGGTDAAPARTVDLSGRQILPGIVDLHGDGFEHHLAPRRGVALDKVAGLRGVDAELGASGVTTAVLAQFFSWEGGMRGPDFADALAEALTVFRDEALADLHLQIRFETHMLDDLDRLLTLVERSGCRYVVFNDHLPHAEFAAGKSPTRLTSAAIKAGRSPEDHLALLRRLVARHSEVPAALARFSETLKTRGVMLGSHDDPNPETRARFRAMGAQISEFPETLAAAEAAAEAGEPVIMGAPNVVRGRSHARKVSARDIVAAGLCTALVSDYHYPSLARAAFTLADEDILPLAEAWALISRRPAEILGLRDRGHLGPGQRADLTVVDPQTRRIEGTLTAGRVSFLAGLTADRFLAA
ncbi:MAG: alpha-D-ribose 1-methylphosphonate 5-triphosphate diphosphatase [Pseudomonadota bacterium]